MNDIKNENIEEVIIGLCDDEGVLAVPGICLRDGATPRTGEDALCVRIYLQNTNSL